MAGDWIPCYRITDGDRYEVNDHGGRWSPGQKKRSGPLDYVRWRAAGLDWGKGYRCFLRTASQEAAAASYGVFARCMEIAANQPVERRWCLLDALGVPLTASTLVIEAGFAEADIARALEVLVSPAVRWLEVGERNSESGDFRGSPGKSREVPVEEQEDKTRRKTRTRTRETGTPGKSREVPGATRIFHPPTVEEVTAYCEERITAGHPPVDAQQWHNHYTANGWMVGRTKMRDWKAAVRTWEKNEFGKGGQHGHDRPSGRHSQETVGRRPVEEV